MAEARGEEGRDKVLFGKRLEGMEVRLGEDGGGDTKRRWRNLAVGTV